MLSVGNRDSYLCFAELLRFGMKEIRLSRFLAFFNDAHSSNFKSRGHEKNLTTNWTQGHNSLNNVDYKTFLLQLLTAQTHSVISGSHIPGTRAKNWFWKPPTKLTLASETCAILNRINCIAKDLHTSQIAGRTRQANTYAGCLRRNRTRISVLDSAVDK